MQRLCFFLFGFSIAAGAWCASTVPATAALVSPLLEYRFNEPSGSTHATGTGTVPATLYLTDAPISNHGVSNGGDDHSLNTLQLNSGRGEHSHNVTAVDGLRRFTLTGWYANAGNNPAGNLWLDDGINLFFRSGGAAPGSLAVFLSGSNGSATVDPTDGLGNRLAYADSNSGGSGVGNPPPDWIFFAVTYDGSLTSDNLYYYQASVNSDVAQLGVARSLNAGQLDTGSRALRIGNSGANGFSFDGLLDDLRLFDVVLTRPELERLRQFDVANSPIVPEPSSFVLWGLGAAALLLVRRRRPA